MFVYNLLRPIYLIKIKVSDLFDFIHIYGVGWNVGKVDPFTPWNGFDNGYSQQGFSALDGIVTGKYLTWVTMPTIHAADVECIQCSREIYYNYIVSYNSYENFRWFWRISYIIWPYTLPTFLLMLLVREANAHGVWRRTLWRRTFYFGPYDVHHSRVLDFAKLANDGRHRAQNRTFAITMFAVTHCGHWLL